MEGNGVPIDVVQLEALRANWAGLKGRLLERINADYGVYVPAGRPRSSESTDAASRWSFSAQRFAAYLAHNGIPWPRLESGRLTLDDDTFRQMARTYPAVAPLRELRPFAWRDAAVH